MIRSRRMLLPAIVMLALVLRWHALDRESLWFDEGWTWWLTTLPASRVFRVIRGDVVAPAYFYLLHGWTTLFGDGVVALRSLSALLSTLCFVPFALIARQTFSLNVATADDGGPPPPNRGWKALLAKNAPTAIAIALLAVASMQVQFARDARPYALLTLASLGAFACLIRAADRRSPRAVAGFVACVVLGLYTHNMMAFTAVGLAGAWLVWPGGRRLRDRATDLAIATVCVGILYLPWLPVMREQARWIAGKFWATHPDLPALAIALSNVAGVDPYAIPPIAWERFAMRVDVHVLATLVCAGVAASILLAVATRDARRRRAGLALCSVALVPPALVYVYSAIAEPVFVSRVFIASGAVVPLIVAMPLAAGRSIVARFVGGLVALGLFALMCLSTTSMLASPQKEDWRGAYERVARLPASERRLIAFVAVEGELPFAFYATHDRSRVAEPRTGVPGSFFDVDPPRTIRRVLSDADLKLLDDAMSSDRWDEIVLVLGHEDFSDPGGRVERSLRTRWRLLDEWSSRHVRVLRFAAPK